MASDKAMAQLIRALSWFLEGLRGVADKDANYIMHVGNMIDALANELDPPKEEANDDDRPGHAQDH